MWDSGYTRFFMWEVKHYDLCSAYGINNGRISKLHIVDLKTKETVCSYDRGWDIKPEENTLAYKLMQDLIDTFN